MDHSVGLLLSPNRMWECCLQKPFKTKSAFHLFQSCILHTHIVPGHVLMCSHSHNPFDWHLLLPFVVLPFPSLLWFRVRFVHRDGSTISASICASDFAQASPFSWKPMETSEENQSPQYRYAKHKNQTLSRLELGQ